MMKLVTITAIVTVFISSSSMSSGVNLEEKLLRLEKKFERKFEEQQRKLEVHEKKSDEQQIKIEGFEQQVNELQSKLEDHKKKSDEQQIKIEGFEQQAKEQQRKLEVHKEKMDEQQIKFEAEVCRADQLAVDISILKYPPFYHSCSYRGIFSSNSQVVSFEKIVYETQGGVGYDEAGGMDIVSGRFTSAHAGTYQVSWHFTNGNNYNDPHIEVFLRKNANVIVES